MGTPSYQLKLERAGKHVVALQAAVKAWLDTDAYTIVSEVEPETGDTTKLAKITSEPWDCIGLIAGDALHNLRTALDHIVYAISEAKLGPAFTSQIEEELMFPIIGNVNNKGKPAVGADTFKSVKGRRLNGVPKDAVAFIESEQPYYSSPTRTDYQWTALWMLHELERVDKHRRINVTTAFMGTPTLHLPEGEFRTKFFRADGPIKNGDKLVTFEGEEQGVQGHFPRHIAFQERIAGTWEITSTIDTISKRVHWIVGHLATFL